MHQHLIKNKGRLLDYGALLLLSILVLLWAEICLKSGNNPLEDAAMLMRYSQHLAEGYGIVWNIGEKPVDGATDFLFMLILGGLVKAGLSCEYSVQLIGTISHLLTVLIIFFCVRFVIKGSTWLAFSAALFVAFGPGLGYVAIYFGTPFFAFFSALSWMFALLIVEQQSNSKPVHSILFSISCLLMGLTRPEGVFLAFFMLIAIVYYKTFEFSKITIIWFLRIFVTLGGLYFFWHWHYFGYPLPNPYYKKGGGHFYLDSLEISYQNTMTFSGCFIIVFLLGLIYKSTRQQTIFILIPIVFFTCLWILMSNEMNHLMRFQYALFPIIYLSWPYILIKSGANNIKPFLHTKFWNIGYASLIFILTAWYLKHQAYYYIVQTHVLTGHDGNYDIARMLSYYSDRGYTLATTEAGLLPLYSNWHSIDVWGLNDQWIAHHGVVDASYLNTCQPDVIVFHGAYHPNRPIIFTNDEDGCGLGHGWESMIQQMRQYTYRYHYDMASCYVLKNKDAIYYFIRHDCKDRFEITRRIRNILAKNPFIG